MSKRETKALLRNKKLIEVDEYVDNLKLNSFSIETYTHEIYYKANITSVPNGIHEVNINFHVTEKDIGIINKILQEKENIILGINRE
jgi:hypothetical protein